MSNIPPFLPFKDFIKSLQKHQVDRLAGLLPIRNADDTNIETMRRYILDYYKGISVEHSFQDEVEQIWDCIPVERQPSFRNNREDLDKNVEFPGQDLKNAQKSQELFTTDNDNYGNKRECQTGKIPVRRLTIEEMAKYPNLNAFFAKSPGRSMSPINFIKDRQVFDDDKHRYAVTQSEVNNLGIDAQLNLWWPQVTDDQLFSLMQTWVCGENDQNIEGGWMVNPPRFGSRPVLFVYWTPDNYNTGSFNLDKPDTFIQLDHTLQLGRPLSPVSVRDGNQIAIRMTWHYTNNRWYLFLNDRVLGYYRTEIFGNGPLRQYSTSLVAGGETCGPTSKPPMGSGDYSTSGFRKSAYVRNLGVFRDGGLYDLPCNPVVFPQNNKYSASPTGDPNWRSSFFLGGPGGNC